MGLEAISVSELNTQIKALLESTFINVFVKGELSRITYHSSGHIYFTLKDKYSAISCVMFKGNASSLKFQLKEGDEVFVNGALSLYTPRGTYQINCFSIEPSGVGALAYAYEQLKKELGELGYFNQNHKKPLPKFPQRVALVTSKTGAALQDMKNVANKRWPLVEMILLDTLVQGDSAKESISKNIKIADNLGVDVIVVARGGGSIEDLWAFNEKIVAKAIYEAKTPIISAIGHEIDFLISDLVADVRAPTPSAAIEILLPDRVEMQIYIDNLIDNFNNKMRYFLNKKQEEINSLNMLYSKNSISAKVSVIKDEITYLKKNFNTNFEFILKNKKQQIVDLETNLNYALKNYLNQQKYTLSSMQNSIQLLNPANLDKNGYGKLSKKGKTVNLEELKKDDNFEISNSKLTIKASVVHVIEI